jgi:hypothetical protein
MDLRSQVYLAVTGTNAGIVLAGRQHYEVNTLGEK